MISFQDVKFNNVCRFSSSFLHFSLQERACGVRQLLRQAGPQVPQLQRAHRRLPVPRHGEDPCRHDQALQIQETGLCRHILRFSEIRTHEEETCLYRPYPCPFDGCAYSVINLRNHMVEYNHGPFFQLDCLGRFTLTLQKSTPLCVLLHRDAESVFLLLNGRDVPGGRSLSVVRLYPRPDEDGAGELPQQYTMVVEGEQSGSLSLKFATVHSREFLFVPDACWGPNSNTVSVDAIAYP